jgi:membrane protease YdiL (CAAX protease family)
MQRLRGEVYLTVIIDQPIGNFLLLDFKPLKQVCLRLLLAFAAVLGAVTVVRLLLVPAIQSIFHPGDSVTSAIRRTGIFLALVSAYWVYVRVVEKRPARELALAPRGIAFGALSGAGMISITTLSLFAFGAYEVIATRGLQTGLIGVAYVILIAALFEEVIFRCILFRILEEASSTLPALCLQSLIFAAMHIANVEDRASTAEVITTVVSSTLMGALWTLVFVYSRKLWVVTAHHAAWNFAIILTGAPLSGLDDWLALAPFGTRIHGASWLTGGVFGPENSVITLVVITICLVALWSAARSKNGPIKDRPTPR